jgi:hypothetical protein
MGGFPLSHITEPDAQRTIRTLRREPVDRVPNYEVLIGQRTTRHLLGRDDVGCSWELAPADHLELIRRIGQDVMVVQVLSWTLENPTDSGGRPHEGNIRSRADLGRAEMPSWERHIRPAAERLREHLAVGEGTGAGVCAGIGSLIFDRSICALGFENFMLRLYEDRSLVEEILEIHTAHCVDLVTEICRHPVAMIHAGDDVAYRSGLLVRPDLFRDLWLDRMRRIVAPAHDAGIPFVFHSDGRLSDVMPLLVELGVAGVNPIEPYSNDIFALKAQWGDRLTLIGNIDIVELERATPAEIESRVRDHLSRLMPGGGHIASSSHSITDQVRPENFRAMVNTVHSHGRYAASPARVMNTVPNTSPAGERGEIR